MAALARLPERQRACVVLRYFEDLDVRADRRRAALQRGHREEPDLAGPRLAAIHVRERVPRRARRDRREEPAVVNDLKHLLRENVADAPVDHLDVDALVGAGRRRVRASAYGDRRRRGAGRRRSSWPRTRPGRAAAPIATCRPRTAHRHRTRPPCTWPMPSAAVEGRDYRGAGVVHEREPRPRQRPVLRRGHRRRPAPLPGRPARRPALPAVRLMDPATGEKDWLPDPDIGQQPDLADRARHRPAGPARRGRRDRRRDARRPRLRPRAPGSGAA